MTKANERLMNWLNELEDFKLPDYESLPDIDLYMDQVVTYLDKTFSVLSTSSLDKIITPSMINNYVKGGVITPPISKKYNKEHLALIKETCVLKQVLSLAEIKQILDIKYKDDNCSAFNDFKQLYATKTEESVLLSKQILRNIDEVDDLELTNLALSLAISANASMAIAKRILFLLKLESE